MSAPANWEEVLKASRFDLPQERWDALEAGLRQRIRQDVATASTENLKPSFGDRFEDLLDRFSEWLSPTPVRWAAGLGALALVAVGGALWLRPGPAIQTASSSFQWMPGQTLEAVGMKEWDWAQGRSHIAIQDGAIHLDRDSAGHVEIQVARGSATFHVEHRNPQESFHVGFGACHIEVVGTTFTISADSLESSAQVIEGRVRFVGAGRDQFLDAGQKLSCSPRTGTGPMIVPVDSSLAAPLPVPVARSTKTVQSPVRTVAPVDQAFQNFDILCQSNGSTCTEARADFVRKFPADPRTPEVAWAWGQSARTAGDLRDALFALDVAAKSTGHLGLRASLSATEIRLGPLPDAERAAKDLDQTIPRLEPGSTLWVRAWTLRRDAARLLNQTAILQRAESLLTTPQAATGGP